MRCFSQDRSEAATTSPSEPAAHFWRAHKLKVYDLTEACREDRVARQTVLAIEKGKYVLSLELAFRTAALFRVRIEDIFVYEGSGKG